MEKLLKKIDATNLVVEKLKTESNNYIHISYIESFLTDIKKQLIDADYEMRLDSYAKYGKEISKQAIHYTNIIITAGYAGFFGLWSISKDFINPTQAKITFILMGVSMFSFVIYEIIDNAFSGSNIANGANALLKAKEQDDLMLKIKWAEIASTYDGYRALWYYQFWHYSFATSVVFGMLAYFILVYVIATSI